MTANNEVEGQPHFPRVYMFTIPDEEVERFRVPLDKYVKQHLLSHMADEAGMLDEANEYKLTFDSHTMFGPGNRTFELKVDKIPPKPERDLTESEQAMKHYWDV